MFCVIMHNYYHINSELSVNCIILHCFVPLFLFVHYTFLWVLILQLAVRPMSKHEKERRFELKYLH